MPSHLPTISFQKRATLILGVCVADLAHLSVNVDAAKDTSLAMYFKSENIFLGNVVSKRQILKLRHYL